MFMPQILPLTLKISSLAFKILPKLFVLVEKKTPNKKTKELPDQIAEEQNSISMKMDMISLEDKLVNLINSLRR